MTMGLCFWSRLFAVIRHESVIHEFDPYFNFRTTRYLFSEGFHEFWNWFDDGSWYPLGRVIGQTLYPGLMTTAACINFLLRAIGVVIDIKDICVFTAPIFSSLSAVAGYLLAKEASCGRSGAGLLGGLFVGMSPSYMSRSVAGSYDNEAVAIFALVFAFYVFIKAINTGRMSWVVMSTLAYFYMVASWGGYVFITNTISIYMVFMMIMGRATERHLAVYNVWYVLGTIMCLNIPFVNFGAVLASEHMASHGVFLACNVMAFTQLLSDWLPHKVVTRLARRVMGLAFVGFVVLFLWASITGKTSWAGRSLTLLDPTYAAKYIPIIASVSEHQPTTWTSYVFDLGAVMFFVPVGLWLCFTRLTDGLAFVGIYLVLAAYFSGVMIRLLLVLAPAAGVVGAIGMSHVVSFLVTHVRSPRLTVTEETVEFERTKSKRGLSSPERSGVSTTTALVCLGLVMSICVNYVSHAVWCSSHAFSHPSIVLSGNLRDGSRMIQDDFREAYYWLRKNTHTKARLMSWWDYGYQSNTMGNRTVLVDNNTWNNTHIATVGLAFASPEEQAYEILQRLDVDYVFVVFGGVARYSSDDINKFLWMIRIASGVYPHIKQQDFFSARGQYSVGTDASATMYNSLMFRLSYYRFGEAHTQGFDMARNYNVGNLNFTLKHLEEVYTTQSWIVRIYKVKKPPNRRPRVKSRW
eukprot:GHVN01053040.1.p1 GENE.GHVN01053040.1~~GHVN01053040.1.p1  ORF type:complete len:725 (+),score=73.69 GHVN01053040.1:104-2176(+)